MGFSQENHSCHDCIHQLRHLIHARNPAFDPFCDPDSGSVRPWGGDSRRTQTRFSSASLQANARVCLRAARPWAASGATQSGSTGGLGRTTSGCLPSGRQKASSCHRNGSTGVRSHLYVRRRAACTCPRTRDTSVAREHATGRGDGVSGMKRRPFPAQGRFTNSGHLAARH